MKQVLEPLSIILLPPTASIYNSKNTLTDTKKKAQELKDRVMDVKDDQFEVTAIDAPNRETGSSEVIPTDAVTPEV